jgi:hypothetical protein
MEPQERRSRSTGSAMLPNIQKDCRDVQDQDDHCSTRGFNQVDHEPSSLQLELARRARYDADANAELSQRARTSRCSVEILLRRNLAI